MHQLALPRRSRNALRPLSHIRDETGAVTNSQYIGWTAAGNERGDARNWRRPDRIGIDCHGGDEEAPASHPKNNSLGRVTAKPPLCSRSLAMLAFCRPRRRTFNPISYRQEIDAGMVRFLPTRRKFRQNLLDRYSCLCASLKGNRNASAGGSLIAGREAAAVDGKGDGTANGMRWHSLSSTQTPDFRARQTTNLQVISMGCPLPLTGALSLREVGGGTA
jgi:hypothetical protein